MELPVVAWDERVSALEATVADVLELELDLASRANLFITWVLASTKANSLNPSQLKPASSQRLQLGFRSS